MLRAKQTIILPLLTAAAFAGVLVAAASWRAAPAQAQMPASGATQAALDDDPLCMMLPETIVTPRTHQFGEPPVWDATHHPLHSSIQLAAGMPTSSGTVMAFGRRIDPATQKTLETVMVELNARGRAAALSTRAVKGDDRPVDLIEADGGRGYIAAANSQSGKRHQFTLSWYDAKAQFLRSQNYADNSFDYDIKRLLPVDNGRGFLAVVNAINPHNESDSHAVLMRFDQAGKIVWRRAYRTGLRNRLLDITPAQGGFIAVGAMDGEDGRAGGWVMKLAADGAIVWQRNYPRGAGAVLRAVAVNGAGQIVVAGDAAGGNVRDSDGEALAAWLMMVDDLGGTVWQRYIRRPDFDLRVAGLLPEPEGRLTLALNAVSVLGDGARNAHHRGHVRLFTVAPNGVLVGDEAYVDGREARAAQLRKGVAAERIVIGAILSDERALTPAAQLEKAMAEKGKVVPDSAQTGDQSPPIAENEPETAPLEHAGWVFVATPLDPYHDPCLEKQHPQGQAGKGPKARLND